MAARRLTTEPALAGPSRRPRRLGPAHAIATLVLLSTPPIVLGQDPSLDAFGLLVATQSRPSLSFLGAGARPAGMGGAFTALADDAAAASFNPAGLALLLTPETSVVYAARERSEDHAAFAYREADEVELYGASGTRFNAGSVNFAAFTLPFLVGDHNLTLQLSYHRPVDFTFGGQRSFSESTGDDELLGTVEQRVSQGGEIETFTLSAAYQLTERLSLGLSAGRWQGGWSFATTTEERALDGSVERLRFTQSNDLGGWRFGAGMLLRYKYLNVGASFRAPFDARLTTESALATSFATPFPDRSREQGTLRWAGSWTLGVAVKPLERWFLTVDYTEDDWDDMVLDGFGQRLNFFDLAPPATTTTRNTSTLRFGSELVLVRRRHVLGLRAGAFIEPRPQLLSENDEKSSLRGFAIGLGWKRGPFAVDLAWQRASSTARVVELVDPETVATGVVEAQAVGRVDTHEDRLFVSLLYQFPSRRALSKVLHFLFVGPLPEPAPPAATPPPAPESQPPASPDQVPAGPPGADPATTPTTPSP